MPIFIYKRTDASRDIPYQDSLLSAQWRKIPEDATVLYDDERDSLVRPSQRRQLAHIHSASVALFADDEKDLKHFLEAAQKKNLILYCHEEKFEWFSEMSIKSFVVIWKASRIKGAAMRGAIKSAQTKKAKTAAALALIYDRLMLPSKDENTTAKLCASVGVSRNSIKNHYGFCREELRRKHEIVQQRKERRNAKEN